ncbi:2-keto-4-pentenoate hydratase [Desulfovibrio sp. OttesenSCG-928-I05]|nr:2-keto-4-pentenoate hydratase [Desulfovibrio sp. OttesenSCG-928-I05]
MNEQTIASIAQALCDAEKSSLTIEKLSVAYPGITVEDAYKIQLEAVKLKEKQGQVIVGKKIGLTNLVMQKAMGITEPDYGHVMDANMAAQDVPLSMSTLVRPSIEAEIAFVLGRDIKGPGITAATVMAAAEGILASFEIVDCRFHDSKIALADTIADNASCGRIILGSRMIPLEGIDLRTIGLVLEKNGTIIDMGVSAAVLGSPAASVAWLANKIASFGVYLKAGEVIMSGSFTNIHPISAGDNFTAHFGGVGSVKASFVE